MSEDRLFIDDLVVLGNACPDIISDYRITVCTAGYSRKHGLVRIYPVPVEAKMKWWNIVSVPLERNPKDTRFESWKIEGSKSKWEHLTDRIEVLDRIDSRDEQRKLIEGLFDKYGASCIEELNRRKVSLGLIKPTILGYEFEKRDDYEPDVQTTLGKEKLRFLTIKNYPLRPILSYRCPVCEAKNPHNQQVVEWGAYEWMRTHPENLEQLWKNYHLGETEYDFRLLVGNMALHRNSFMVISIFRFKRDAKGFRPLDEFSNQVPVAGRPAPLVA